MTTTTSSNGQGAASAALGLRPPGEIGDLDQWLSDANLALIEVRTEDEAEILLKQVRAAELALQVLGAAREQVRVWSILRLQAERRYGELLPPKKTAGRPPKLQHTVTNSKADGMAKTRARQVADVPKEKFDDYVDTTPKPTRAGLLNKVKAKAKPKPKPTPDPRNRHGKKPTKLERKGVLWMLHGIVEEFASKLEHIDPRVCDVSRREDLDTLVYVRDMLIDLDIWKGDVERTINAKIGDQGIREKIATLRDPNGKYAAELKRCQEVADRLERRLNNKLGA